MDQLAEEWRFCSETDRGLWGPSKSLGWAGAHGRIGCGEKVLREWAALGHVFRLLLAWYPGGYRNRPIKSYADSRRSFRL